MTERKEDGRLVGSAADRATRASTEPCGLGPVGRVSTDAVHTPGPWSYRPMEHDDWGIVRAPNEPGQFAGGIICQAYDPDARDEVTLDRHREARTDPWEANARLIAAAPEMLEALEETARDMREAADKLREYGATLSADILVAQAAKSRAVIAKATGAA